MGLPTLERVVLPALRAPGPAGWWVVDELGKTELASADPRDALPGQLVDCLVGARPGQGR